MRCLSLLSLACLLAACEGQSPSSSSSPARSLAAVESLDPSDVTPTSIHESASSCAYAYEPISLRGWTEQNYPVINDRPGDWVLKDDGYGVLQKNNGQPTLFASNFTVGRVNIIGRMIQSPKSDDDFFGFVLGYSLGEYRDPGAEFLLVDWKRGDQEHDFGSPSDTPGGLAEEGLALSRVNGVPTADEFWTHKDFSHSSSPVGQGLKELKRARTLGRTPWKPNVEYTFRFEMGEAGLRVFVAEGDGPESLELSMRGDYSRYVKGRFAFYNFSQSNVSYSGFKRRLRCAPVAPNSWFQTRKNVMASTVLFAASPEGPPTYVIQTYPAHGTLVQNGAALNYIPHPGYAGPDAFLWYATDEVSNSNVARVDINVINALPVAYDQSLWTRRNHAKPITLTASDADNEPLVYTLLSLPAHGTLTQNGAQVTYTPHRGYAGPDSFTFWASDSTTHGNAATVSIEVVNTPPVARDDSIVTLTTLPKDMLLPASDVDGDDLVYSIVTPPTSGTLRQAGNLVTYVPRGGDVSYYDSFTFRVSDGLAFSNTATVFVQVVNDRACLLFPGRWGPTGWLRGPRLEHTAGLLSNGQVLVSGGFVRPSELYDPAVGTWTTGGDALSTHRYHSMTLLNDGRVLVAGGEGSEAADFTEIYDPAARLWLPAARMDKARQWHTATLLTDGRVLVVGGAESEFGPVHRSAELYSPGTGSWAPTRGSMRNERRSHTATLLQDGRVLITGGLDKQGNPLTAIDIYDPITDVWNYVGSMRYARGLHTATLLNDGRVLLAGGGATFATSSTAEVYDPVTQTSVEVNPMGRARRYHTATLLPDGRVFVVGGFNDEKGILTLAELFDPSTGTWTHAGCTSVSRWGATSTLLLSGDRVLVTGGVSKKEEDQATVELYFLSKP